LVLNGDAAPPVAVPAPFQADIADGEIGGDGGGEYGGDGEYGGGE
jgi:hypothetical protein